MKRLVFIGASGHGKVCAEIAELNRYEDILFLDDDRQLKECSGHTVVGIEADFLKLVDDSVDFFVSIGNTDTRKRIQYEIVEAGGNIATLVHPESIIGKDVKIGAGSVVMAGAVINLGTTIGEGVIVNTLSSIDHDCMIGDYCHIAVGSHICGTVEVGCGCWIGAGATVSNNVNICDDCVVGTGAVVIKDIDVPGTYVGMPVIKKEK